MIIRRLRVRSSERGSALVEITWLTLLLLIPLIYVLLAVFTVQRAAYGAEAATRAAGRAYVLAPDQSAARARALAAAELTLDDHDLTLTPGDLDITCEPVPDSCLSPESVVIVSLDTNVALPWAPDLFSDTPPSVRVSSTHRAPYGTFREARP